MTPPPASTIDVASSADTVHAAARTRPRPQPSPRPRRVFMLGATGTIGRATARALMARGHSVACFVRPKAGVGGTMSADDIARMLPGAELRLGGGIVTGKAALLGWVLGLVAPWS